ncbi:MAG: L,D-transpeptidase family protein [Candidatus Aminicenantes bacterium]|nr:L,D-transpeptidase family protein [Candidatus Aminicenantes bacterium]
MRAAGRLLVPAAALAVLVAPSTVRSFQQEQLRYPRVRAAYIEKTDWMITRLAEKGLKREEIHILIRAFKREKVLELWVRKRGRKKHIHLLDYPFCATSGVLGPKRRQGDLQIPEGYYHIDRFNPWSRFHLSLGINYPNALDRIHKTAPDPGGDIFIHGSCVTIGCIPLTDDKIKALYLFAVEARSNGQEQIPVHIFPVRMSAENVAALQAEFFHRPDLIAFWKNLQTGYEFFADTQTIPPISVSQKGEYIYQK